MVQQGHLVLLVGGAYSQARRAAWHPGGNCWRSQLPVWRQSPCRHVCSGCVFVQTREPVWQICYMLPLGQTVGQTDSRPASLEPDLELFATQRAEPLVFTELLGVGRQELLHLQTSTMWAKSPRLLSNVTNQIVGSIKNFAQPPVQHLSCQVSRRPRRWVSLTGRAEELDAPRTSSDARSLSNHNAAIRINSFSRINWLGSLFIHCWELRSACSSSTVISMELQLTVSGQWKWVQCVKLLSSVN